VKEPRGKEAHIPTALKVMTLNSYSNLNSSERKQALLKKS
jgi:hypothetical protein